MLRLGVKQHNQCIGYVADFCPFCRGIQAFGIVQRNVGGHVYGVSVGNGTVVGYERICAVCGYAEKVDPLQYRRHEDDESKLEINALIQKTHPDIHERYAKRLAAEAAIRSGETLDSHTRLTMLAEPFELMAPTVAQLYAMRGVAAFVLGQKRRAQRPMQAYVYPNLARHLLPLNPSEDEIRDILKRLVRAGSACGTHLELGVLMAFIERHRQAALPDK